MNTPQTQFGGSLEPVGSDAVLIDRAIDRLRGSREAAHLRVWAPILWDEGEAIIREIERLRALPNAPAQRPPATDV